jgi:hypothetical protein
MDDRAEDAAGIGTIHTSYSFDVHDKSKVVKFSEEVFIGRVLRKTSVDEKESSTIWTVAVVDSVKGKATSGEVQVRQLGYVDGDGRLHQTEDQPVLEPGQDYLLAVNSLPSGGYVLVAGPTASVKAETAAKKEKLKKEYAEAAK